MSQKEVRIKYLITTESDVDWGLTITSVGFQHIDRNTQYPPSNHPSRYLFSIEKGRVLDEYQLLYIIKGKGTFITKGHKPTAVSSGQLFILFPGVWHNYYPDKQTGWDEYWIGFNSRYMDDLVKKNFFDPNSPLLNVGVQEEVTALYKQAINFAAGQKSGYQHVLAGIVYHLLGYAYYFNKNKQFEHTYIENLINEAKIFIHENFHSDITPEEIAHHANISYSWFRKIFKQYTGLSPNQYLQEVRILKSKELLTNTAKHIKEITFEIGFNNREYFTTLFRRKTGYTPDKYREFTQGRNL